MIKPHLGNVAKPYENYFDIFHNIKVYYKAFPLLLQWNNKQNKYTVFCPAFYSKSCCSLKKKPFVASVSGTFPLSGGSRVPASVRKETMYCGIPGCRAVAVQIER